MGLVGTNRMQTGLSRSVIVLAIATSLVAVWSIIAPIASAQQRDQFAELRNRMVDDEIVKEGIKNEAVIKAMRTVPRHKFVVGKFAPEQAYHDQALPIGQGQTISPPFIVAYMTESLDPQPSDRVLEIGTGSGYFAALMASLAAEVVSVEIDAGLAESARTRLARMGFDNVRVETGDGANGWGSESYDAVVLTGSTPIVADALVAQVSPGGRLFAIVGDAPAMTARIIRWDSPGSRLVVDLFETVVEPLVNAPAPDRFRF